MSDNHAGVSFEFLEQDRLAQFNNLRNTNDRFETFTAVGGSWHGVRAAKNIFKFLDKILANCFTLECDDEVLDLPFWGFHTVRPLRAYPNWSINKHHAIFPFS